VDENCILVANHQNTCDISALMWPLVTLSGLKGAVTWIMDAIFKLSSFGWVCLGHDDFFIWQQADAKQFKFAAPCDPEHIKEHELAVSLFFISVKKKIRDYCKGAKKISSLEVTLLFVKNWVVKDRVGL
jgi:hypothetical protein